MDSREAPLFVVAQGWRTVCYCPLERRGRHSANPYGFDAAGIARLGACRELLRTSRSNPARRRMLWPSLESPFIDICIPDEFSARLSWPPRFVDSHGNPRLYTRLAVNYAQDRLDRRYSWNEDGSKKFQVFGGIECTVRCTARTSAAFKW